MDSLPSEPPEQPQEDRGLVEIFLNCERALPAKFVILRFKLLDGYSEAVAWQALEGGTTLHVTGPLE